MPSLRSRRSILRTLGCLGGVGVAGCVGDEPSFPTVEVEPRYPPAEAPGEIEIELRNQYDRRQPARLRIRFTNSTDRTRTYDFGPAPPYSYPYGRYVDVEAFLVSVPTHDHEHVQANVSDDDDATAVIPDRPDGDCWQSTARVSVPPMLVPQTLQPSETVQETYALLAPPENAPGADRCLQPGRYHFRSINQFEKSSHEWGFSVVLS